MKRDGNGKEIGSLVFVYPFAEEQKRVSEREAAYRRALEKLRVLPQSIELMIADDREWLDGKQSAS